MAGFYDKKDMSIPAVLVVHCIDTEGPIGGDVRRNPDGTQEFYDNWVDIKDSLEDLTSEDYRRKHCDSFGNPFMLNWFIMDFTGFKTNPKNRIPEYNDTYDNIKSLNTSYDSFHWHYHQPPSSGQGDQWSEDWDSSLEHYNVLGHRLLDRQDFPEAFRAGGTIEDNKCSHWLEDNLMIDYSNRVSYKSYPADNIFDFNWHSAPDDWGLYHPSRDNFLEKGNMKRVIVKSVDLKSRFHLLEEWEVSQAFSKVKQESKPVILSYFSHDHRDMRAETSYAIDIIRRQSREKGIPFMWCDAKEAVRILKGIQPIKNVIGVEKSGENQLMIHFRHEVYQKNPFVFTKDKNDVINYHKLDLEWIPNCPYYLQRCFLTITPEMKTLGIACTSLSGDKAIKVLDL
jgi:hypothetical protein